MLIAAVLLVITAGCAETDSGEQSTAGSVDVPDGTIEVHMINVGQSVSTLIVTPSGETMLIDTGDFKDRGKYVLQYLEQHDIGRIDHLVVSHNDADHIGGNAAIIEHFETEADGIGAIYDPGIAASTNTYEAYLDAVETHDVTLYETREGDSIAMDGPLIRVLGPPEPYLANEARNENSIVLMLRFGETNFLFSGDAEDEQETYLVDTYGSALQSTVLKAGHHGSKSSSSEGFLDAVDPQAVVISSAYDSRYGHPDEVVLERLSRRSVPTYWTGTHGDIVLTSDGENVQVKTQRDAPTDASSIREGTAVEPGTIGTVQIHSTLTADASDEPVATDGGTSEDAALTVAEVHADAAGDDRDNLNDEYLVFRNEGGTELDLSGWTVSDEAGQTYTIPNGVTIGADETVTLHTGGGAETETDLYWNSERPIWNNDGDTVIVTTTNGTDVLRETY